MKKRINFIPISGGKDSQAVAIHYLYECKLPKEEAVFCFCDVENEHKDVYEHLVYLERKLDINIIRLRANLTDKLTNINEKFNLSLDNNNSVFFNSMVLHRSPPRMMGRWCTKELKIDVMYEYIDSLNLPNKDTDVIIWQGMRKEESTNRAKLIKMQEYSPGIYLYRPILEWTLEDVLNISKKFNIDINPLYSKASRVGCYPCIFSSQNEIALLEESHVKRILSWEVELANLLKILKPKATSGYYPFLLRPDALPYNNMYDIWVYYKQTNNISSDLKLEAQCENEYGLCE